MAGTVSPLVMSGGEENEPTTLMTTALTTDTIHSSVTSPVSQLSQSFKSPLKVSQLQLSATMSERRSQRSLPSPSKESRLRRMKSSSYHAKRQLQRAVSKRFGTNKKVIKRALSQYLLDEEVQFIADKIY